MSESFQSRNQSSMLSTEIAAVAAHLASHLRGRLLDISLTVQRGGVIIGGRRILLCQAISPACGDESCVIADCGQRH